MYKSAFFSILLLDKGIGYGGMSVVKIDIIGAPTAFGQPKLGVSLGPDAVRFSGLEENLKSLGHDVSDIGNVYGNYKTVYRKDNVKDGQGLINFDEVRDFSEHLSQAVDNTLKNKRFPFVIGGDHSLSIGSVSAVSHHYSNLGVLWIDAHGDINSSDTSPSGNIHGMPLGVLLGEGNEALVNINHKGAKLKHENIVLVGVRDLDAGEKAYIKKHGIKCYTMSDVARLGLDTVITKALKHLQECDGIHLSLDVDSLDPMEMPGTGTKVDGGIFLSDMLLALNILSKTEQLVSADLVEVNPLLDNRNKTAVKAVTLAEYIFGQSQI